MAGVEALIDARAETVVDHDLRTAADLKAVEEPLRADRDARFIVIEASFGRVFFHTAVQKTPHQIDFEFVVVFRAKAEDDLISRFHVLRIAKSGGLIRKQCVSVNAPVRILHGKWLQTLPE